VLIEDEKLDAESEMGEIALGLNGSRTIRFLEHRVYEL